MDPITVGRTPRAAPKVGAVRRARPRRPGIGAGHAVRAVSQRAVRRAPAPHHVGPGDRAAHRPAGRAAAGRHLRRHHPRPRAVRGVPGGRREHRGHAGSRSASSTRRWSTSPGSATCSRSVRRPGGSSTSPTTRCWCVPGARAARSAAVLEGRHPRPAGRARARARRVRPRRRRPTAGGVRCRAALGGPRRLRRRQPARLPGRAAAGDRGRAGREDPGGGTVPRRAGGLAARAALAVRRGRACAVGAGHRGPDAGALRRRRRGHARRRRHRAAAAGRRVRGRASRSSPTCCCSTRRRSRPR